MVSCFGLFLDDSSAAETSSWNNLLPSLIAFRIFCFSGFLLEAAMVLNVCTQLPMSPKVANLFAPALRAYHVAYPPRRRTA
mmetsp:Transcript_57397/g.113135  ORF Transcript_57397/g.113135 Transcript_57397/m.113135 type:complete len:81 (+) Transcript_57397:915-1157(+)